MDDTLSRLRGEWPAGLWHAGCLLSPAWRSFGGCTAVGFPSLILPLSPFHLSGSSHDNACCHLWECRVGRNQPACQQWAKHSPGSLSGHSWGTLICFAFWCLCKNKKNKKRFYLELLAGRGYICLNHVSLPIIPSLHTQRKNAFKWHCAREDQHVRLLLWQCEYSTGQRLSHFTLQFHFSISLNGTIPQPTPY